MIVCLYVGFSDACLVVCCCVCVCSGVGCWVLWYLFCRLTVWCLGFGELSFGLVCGWWFCCLLCFVLSFGFLLEMFTSFLVFVWVVSLVYDC